MLPIIGVAAVGVNLRIVRNSILCLLAGQASARISSIPVAELKAPPQNDVHVKVSASGRGHDDKLFEKIIRLLCSNRGEALLFPSFDTIPVKRDEIGLSLTRLDGNHANSRKVLRAILAALRP